MKKKIYFALVLVLLFSALSSTVFAANSDDTAFSFNLGANVSDRTSFRAKTDTSYVYSRTTKVENPFSLSAVARKSSAFSGTINYDLSSSYTITAPCVRLINNYIKETYYNFAALRGLGFSGSIYTASGFWSPDTV